MHDRTVNPGTLIVFEGLDGAGKSTQVQRLVAVLERAGYEVCITREPTDGEFGAKIRALSSAGADLPPETELALFMDDRREHVQSCLEPELSAGHVVVCDRYYLSTVAYQGAHGLSPEAILEQNEREFPIPDLVILLRIDAERGLERVDRRGAERNLSFERRDFLERATRVFDSIDRDYLVTISGAMSEDEVHAAVLDAVRRHTRLEID